MLIGGQTYDIYGNPTKMEYGSGVTQNAQNLINDYGIWFKDMVASGGGTTDLGTYSVGGSGTFGDPSYLTFTGNDGTTTNAYAGTNLYDLYQNDPYLKSMWDEQYGINGQFFDATRNNDWALQQFANQPLTAGNPIDPILTGGNTGDTGGTYGGSTGGTDDLTGSNPLYPESEDPLDTSLTGGTGGMDFSGVGDPYSMGYNQSMSYSGLNPVALGLLNQVLGFTLPAIRQAQDNVMGLPAKIDKWSNDLSNSYRIGTDDIINTLTAYANNRAARGIMGGTESDNLRANMMYSLAQDVAEKRRQAQADAMNQKISAIMSQPGALASAYSTLGNLLGMGSQSFSTSAGMDYQTDPTAMAGIIADLIQSNF